MKSPLYTFSFEKLADNSGVGTVPPLNRPTPFGGEQLTTTPPAHPLPQTTVGGAPDPSAVFSRATYAQQLSDKALSAKLTQPNTSHVYQLTPEEKARAETIGLLPNREKGSAFWQSREYLNALGTKQPTQRPPVSGQRPSYAERWERNAQGAIEKTPFQEYMTMGPEGLPVVNQEALSKLDPAAKTALYVHAKDVARHADIATADIDRNRMNPVERTAYASARQLRDALAPKGSFGINNKQPLPTAKPVEAPKPPAAPVSPGLVPQPATHALRPGAPADVVPRNVYATTPEDWAAVKQLAKREIANRQKDQNRALLPRESNLYQGGVAVKDFLTMTPAEVSNVNNRWGTLTPEAWGKDWMVRKGRDSISRLEVGLNAPNISEEQKNKYRNTLVEILHDIRVAGADPEYVARIAKKYGIAMPVRG